MLTTENRSVNGQRGRTILQPLEMVTELGGSVATLHINEITGDAVLEV